MVDLVRQAFAKQHINVQYKVMPWAQAVDMVRQGKFDAVIGASRGDAPDFVYPETVQGISIIQAWVREDSKWRYFNLHSLDGQRIGVVTGYSYSKVLDPYLKKRAEDGSNQIHSVNKSNAAEVNIGELLAGSIDVILEDRNVVDYYFNSHKVTGSIKAVGNPVEPDNYDDTYLFVAFSPANPKSKEYAQVMTRAMQDMRQSGELKDILASYNMDNLYRYLGEQKSAQQ